MSCAVLERAYRTLRNKLYKYFTNKNSYRFDDVLQQFVKSYNTVYTAHGMAPAAVIEKHFLVLWTRMNDRRSCVRVGKVEFNVGQHVRSKEKMKFAKV